MVRQRLMNRKELVLDAYSSDKSGRHPLVAALQDAQQLAAKHELFLTMHLIHDAVKKVGYELAAHAEGERYTPHGPPMRHEG